MRKLVIIICVTAIAVFTALSILEADKNTKSVAGFTGSNTVFAVNSGSVTILNKEFRLK